MIRLENLTLRKLGNVAPDTALRFGPRGALLLGTNGTGKSTLLNVIVAALRSDWPALLRLSGDGFDLGYSLAVQPEGSACFFLDVTMKAAPPPPAAERFLQFDSGGSLPPDYELHLTLRDAARTEVMRGRSQSSQTTVQFLDGEEKTRPSPSYSPADLLMFVADQSDAATLGARVGEHLSRTLVSLYRLDEAYGYYEQLTDDRDKSRALLSFYYPPVAVRVPGAPPGWASPLLSAGTARALRSTLPPGDDFPERVRIEATHQAAPPVPEVPRWLLDFCQWTDIDKLSINLEQISIQRSSSAVIAKYGPVSLHYSQRSASLRGEQLSFGQKRLFSILHYLDANPDLVVADELVNGLHHEWIRRCVDALDHRQAFLSSQNPILFDFTYFESAEEVAERFIECSLDEQGRFCWGNMSARDANEFYATYQVGIQHVSAILRTKGYW